MAEKKSVPYRIIRAALIIFGIALVLMLLEGRSDEPPKGSIIHELTNPTDE